MTEWRGKKIAIRNEKIRVFLLNYREFQAQIDNADLTDEEKLEKHGEIIMECGESIDLVKQELRQGPSSKIVTLKSQSLVSDWIKTRKIFEANRKIQIIDHQLKKASRQNQIYLLI